MCESLKKHKQRTSKTFIEEKKKEFNSGWEGEEGKRNVVFNAYFFCVKLKP